VWKDQDMSSLFSRIIQGDIPCARIYEDEQFFAFLDIRPLHAGHTLLVPKQETDYLFDMPEDLLAAMLPVAKPIARALQACVPCLRVGLVVAGLEVPHCHLHLIPMETIGDLDFKNARPADPAALQALATRIRSQLP
jgi:histidine triad (HIT) family protein